METGYKFQGYVTSGQLRPVSLKMNLVWEILLMRKNFLKTMQKLLV